MAEYRCGQCGKAYRSKGWLRRHQRQMHMKDDSVSLPTDSAVRRQGVEAPLGVQDTEETGKAPTTVQAFGPKALERALVDLGIEPDNVMAHRVYPDRVVIIEGPLGFKRVWMMPGREHGSGAG